MFNRFIQSILLPYRHEPFLLQEKVKLFAFCIIFEAFFSLTLIPIINILFDFFFINFILAGLALCAVLNYFLLKRGRYFLAANITTMFFTFTFISMGLYGQFMNNDPNFITNMYYYPFVIIFTALFCEPLWVLFITLLLIGNGVFSFVLLSRSISSTMLFDVVKGAFFDYTLATIFSFIACYLLVRLYTKINSIALSEAELAQANEEDARREKDKAESALVEVSKKNVEIEKISEELRREKGSLEQKVIERTSDLMQANLKLQELDTLKSNFFSNVSHEIRTPLTLILSPIEAILQNTYKKEINKDFFDNIYRNALRLLKLINNILDFSKIEAGRMGIRIKNSDIVQFIKNYIAAVSSAADTKEITIRYIPEKPSIDNVWFDLEKMDKIMMNLFSNALKFTEPGGTIYVTVRDDDVFCYIEFRDTGVGIPPDMLEVIFDRFSQADSKSSRQNEGTGIGLALTKELVKMHGGTITVDSRFKEEHPADHGTTFTVTLLKGYEHYTKMDYVTFAEDDASDDLLHGHRYIGAREMHDLGTASTVHEEVTAAVNDALPGDAPRVLVVDDNSDMRNFLKLLLQGEYRLRFAVNGEDGLRAANEFRPDIILTDVMMPVMNGYEMTVKIKSDPGLRQIPVIMLTAKAEVDNRIEGFEFGADDYLAKPFNAKELMTRIKSILRSREYDKLILERNKQVEQELEIARKLQRNLFPETIMPVAGYRTHAVYIPMDKVGGDFYDYRLRNGLIELFIADVSGHGLSGAFLSTIAKISFESIVKRQSTRDLLMSLNDVICRTTVMNNYVTSFFAIIDTGTRVMKYTSAGHLPQLVYRGSTGEFIELWTKGKPLGLFHDLTLNEKEIALMPGDRLILFTDGITECMDRKGDLYEYDRFKECIASHVPLTPDIFAEKIIDELKRYSSSESFNDDLTMLIVDII